MFSTDSNRLKGKTARTELCFFPLCFTGNYFTAGPLSHCSESQKNAILNEPNMKIIMPVIFGTHTK